MTKYTSDDWCTPEPLTKLLGFFDLDPCSNSRSHIRTAETCSFDHALVDHRDGLAFDWTHRSVFLNWPYSNPGPWAAKVAEHKSPWVVLAKADPTTRWFAAMKLACTGDAPFRARLKFERPDKPTVGANFPSHLFWYRWTPSAELAGQLWLPTYARAA